MLYKETVDKDTLDLLTKLQQKEYLKGFHLVGGTSLSLRIGHRKSDVIDIFSNLEFDERALLENLTFDFPFRLFYSSKNTLKGGIGNVKIDILARRYPLINEPEVIEGISMLSIQDVIAMKINAITTSGQRVKDFIDIYFLLEKYSIGEMGSFYSKKYSQYNEVNVLKSLTWFEDIDMSDWPLILKDPGLDIGMVKKRIVSETNRYIKKLGY